LILPERKKNFCASISDAVMSIEGYIKTKKKQPIMDFALNAGKQSMSRLENKEPRRGYFLRSRESYPVQAGSELAKIAYKRWIPAKRMMAIGWFSDRPK
jgi:hypothetical protein